MKIGILCADDREVIPFIPMIQGCETTEKAMLKFYEGKINGVEVVALFAGSCKTNAALAAQILIDTYGCDVIINSGTAGGMDPAVGLLDTVICTESAYHDVSATTLTIFHPLMESIYMQSDAGLVSVARKVAEKMETGHTIHFGKMVTGEQFIVQESRESINRRFAPLSVDMETASIAHVCYVNKIPFIAVRTITDTEECCGEEYYQENCDKASQISADIVAGMLDELREMYYYELVQRYDQEDGQSNTMKERFVRLLEAKGLTVEMGLTPVTDMFVLHVEREAGEDGDYWFVETEDTIETRITNFVRWNIGSYIFARVENDDYVNGRYAIGALQDLKDFGNPAGVQESAEFMTLTFDELAERLK